MKKTRSDRVSRLGKDHCDLCGERGTSANPLRLHHIDSEPKHNAVTNCMATHRNVCHDFADFVSVFLLSRDVKPTVFQIQAAWRETRPHFYALARRSG